MNLDAQVDLWFSLIVSSRLILWAGLAYQRQQRREKRADEEARITPHTYLPLMRDELTEPPTNVSSDNLTYNKPAVPLDPWPTRQTPTDLAAAYQTSAPTPYTSPSDPAGQAIEPGSSAPPECNVAAWGRADPLPPPHLPIRGRAYLPRRRIVATVGHVVVDENGCGVPCLAWHCALHGPPGTEAQRGGHAWTEAVRRALFTPTAEWDVRAVGVQVPDVVPEGVELLHIGMRELADVT